MQITNELLLGWYLEGNQKSHRAFPKSQSSGKYSDVARAERLRGDKHLVTFAPTGSGKGVGVIIPNLLHYSGPVITIDPKGENFAVTASYRKNKLGQKIVLLDPFEHVSQETLDRVGVARGSLNPLDLITAFGSYEEIQVSMIASILAGNQNIMVDQDHQFWNQEAQKLIAGVIGVAVTEAKKAGKQPSFQNFIDRFFTDDLVYNLAVVLDTIGKELGSYKERSGVVSTAQSFLTPFISTELNRYLDHSTLSLSDISIRDDYTVYVVMPPSKLISHAILLRLWVATIMNTIMERGESPLRRTLFLLDECAQLGALDELRKAVTLLRGYGLQVWMFFQDVSQLRSLYEEDSFTILHNCGVVQAFGISHYSAAQEIAKIVGRYRANDITNLDITQQLLLTSSRIPHVARKMCYYSDKAFAGKFSPNPLFGKGSLGYSVQQFPPNIIKNHY